MSRKNILPDRTTDGSGHDAPWEVVSQFSPGKARLRKLPAAILKLGVAFPGAAFSVTIKLDLKLFVGVNIGGFNPDRPVFVHPQQRARRRD